MRIKVVIALGAFAVASSASASETVTYSYDALGRLVGSVTAGGANSGISTGTSFDPAGNRTSYTVSGASAAQIPRSTVRTAQASDLGRQDGARTTDVIPKA